MDSDRVNNTWLGQFLTILVAQRDFETFLQAIENISFVSFNYDRCIHQFFAHAASLYFKLSDDQVQQLLGSLEVIYPYGSVGEYKWHQGNSPNFGKVCYTPSLAEAEFDGLTAGLGTIQLCP
jgi:hypothetical protein